MKETYNNVINFVSTRCPYANVQVFKDNCRRFGQDQMSLDAFFSYLLSICTHALMKELVPELVRLLPTQEKRERLWVRTDYNACCVMQSCFLTPICICTNRPSTAARF